MMRKSFVSRVSLAASLFAAFLLATTASAFAGTLDQQQTEQNANGGLYVGQDPAQTFTAGITGGLDQADLLLCCKFGTPVEPLTVEIRNTSGGEPGASVLASASIPMSALGSDPAFVPATFATPAAVTAGIQYALVVYTAHPDNDCCGWNYQTGDLYSGGTQFLSHTFPAQPPWDQSADNDYAFKTYVTPPPPAAVPPTPPTTTVPAAKKKCKKHKKKHSAESAKKKKCKKKKKKKKHG
jgi:hypothetical protein